MSLQTRDDRSSASDNAWFPPPLDFPGAVDDVFAFFDRRISTILDTPPSLDGDALALACEGDPQLERTLREGQKAFAEGALSAARERLEKVADRSAHAAAMAGLACYALGRISRAVFHWDTVGRLIDDTDTPSLYLSLIRLGVAMIKQNRALHPEADAMTLLCRGKGIDVGCGGYKTCPNAIGVDLTPQDTQGRHGGQRGVPSAADIVASGDALPMFEDGEMDFVIARHNLEHYQDHIEALLEWTRILRPGGVMGVVAPDHDWVDTIRLDPTHYHVFTLDSLRRLFGLLPGLGIAHAGVMSPRWSVMLVARKAPADEPFDYRAAYRARERERIAGRMDAYAARGAGRLAAECEKEMRALENTSGA